MLNVVHGLGPEVRAGGLARGLAKGVPKGEAAQHSLVFLVCVGGMRSRDGGGTRHKLRTFSVSVSFSFSPRSHPLYLSHKTNA